MTARVGIAPGAGLVGRFGDTVVLIAQDGGADDGVAESLLELVETAAAQGDPPGRAIVARLADWLVTRPPGDETAFGLVAPLAQGTLVLLRGAIWAEVAGGEQHRRLSGRRALPWTDQVLRFPVERVALAAPAGSFSGVHPLSDLRAGVIPAQGFEFTPSGGPAAALAAPVHLGTIREADATRAVRLPAPPAVGPAPVAAEPIGARGWTRETPAVTADDLTAEAVTADDLTADDVPAVTGWGAAAPVPADPERDEPAPTELADPQPARAFETMLAELPSGTLVADGGPTIVLDRDYVLGREPYDHPAVQSGEASPVVVSDPENLISRVHAYVSVDDGRVSVRDAGSATGTYVAAPGDAEWTPVGQEPARIHPDWSVRIGTRVLVFRLT